MISEGIAHIWHAVQMERFKKKMIYRLELMVNTSHIFIGKDGVDQFERQNKQLFCI